MEQTKLISIQQIINLNIKYTSTIRSFDKPTLAIKDIGVKKEPKYSIDTMTFDEVTRYAKIDFKRMQEYRTIDGYKQIDCEKYPIYSEWKHKEKIISKSIKLTNRVLESLNQNDDELIKLFADKIVLQLNNYELFPSWFLKYYLRLELADKITVFEQKLRNEENTISANIVSCKKSMAENTSTAIMLKNNLVKMNNDIELKRKFIEKKEAVWIYIVKSILSFGIYAILNSQKRKELVARKIEKTKLEMSTIISNIENLLESEKQTNLRIANFEKDLEAKKNECLSTKNLLNEEYYIKISKVMQLQDKLCLQDEFCLLKNFQGFTYESIKGCYVIRNRENGKHYVGQSKDVYKRIKDHFRGTQPINYIFCEDYFNSKLENKDDLFEIKIYKCETKDELDALEQHLIQFYDAKNDGYNRTNGNS